MRLDRLPTLVLKNRFVPGGWDVLAFVLVFAFLIYLAGAAHGLTGSLSRLEATPISLEPAALVGYAARTALRMLIAMLASLVFTFTYATLAAKSRRAEIVLVPLLDILQSLPILGFSITIVFFLSLTPGRVAGAEMAAIFLIFTSQAWNMAFSFYHSLRSIPYELDEAARSFRLSPWMRFWRLEVPFAMPPLIWNMMMSMSGGWFFVVAAEAIDLGNTKVTLPGVGSYVALAIEQRNLGAIGWAIAAMFVVILVFDQLLFRPLIGGADWFRLEQEAGLTPSNSWALTMMRRSRFLAVISRLFVSILNIGFRARGQTVIRPREAPRSSGQHLGDFIWYVFIALVGIIALLKAVQFVFTEITLTELGHVIGLGLLTFLRVGILIAIASLIWVPIGVYVGLRPRVANIVQPIAQFLAAFPVNLIYPIAVSGIVLWKLNPDIWLSPLMILGTQWYILFNVIVGASAIPADMRYAGQNFHVRGWLWWKRIALPAVFPFYVTGAITASGGSWNASVVSEAAEWGQEPSPGRRSWRLHLARYGHWRFPPHGGGIVVMALFVVVLNRVFWKPLYARAERKFRNS